MTETVDPETGEIVTQPSVPIATPVRDRGEEHNNQPVGAGVLDRLAAPFRPEVISWRVGATTQDKTKGMALAYIDARDVQDRLDQVCGVFWQCRHHPCGGSLLACSIGIKVGEEWIWRGDGAGEVDLDANLRAERKDQMQDMAQKAAFSDAFKRAAVRWGIGRYLYDLDSPWVELEARGSSRVIKSSELNRLRQLLRGRLSNPAAPEPRPDIETQADARLREEANAAVLRIRREIANAAYVEELDAVGVHSIGAREDGILIRRQKGGEQVWNDLMSRDQKRRNELALPPRQDQAVPPPGGEASFDRDYRI